MEKCPRDASFFMEVMKKAKSLSVVRFNEVKDCTLWNAHPNTLHRNSQGERKENEGGHCLEIFLGSLSDSIFA
jgi:cell division protein ftsX